MRNGDVKVGGVAILKRVARRDLTLEQRSGGSERTSHGRIQGRRTFWAELSGCKGSEAAVSWGELGVFAEQ